MLTAPRWRGTRNSNQETSLARSPDEHGDDDQQTTTSTESARTQAWQASPLLDGRVEEEPLALVGRAQDVRAPTATREFVEQVLEAGRSEPLLSKEQKAMVRTVTTSSDRVVAVV